MKAAALLVAATLAAGTAQGFEFCDNGAKRQEFQRSLAPWGKTFREKKVDEIERHFGNLVKQHAAGKLDDQLLSRWFGIFACSDPGCEPKIFDWVAKYPDSEAARLALAVYYVHVGYAARGRDYASKTSRAQFAAMSEAFRKALVALDSADRYSKKPTFSASLRIEIARSMPIGATPTEIYRKAIKAYPDTLQVRLEYIWASNPKWGGSLEQLASIVDDAKRLPKSDARYIEYLVLQEMGSTMELAEDDKRAVELYGRSIAICPGLDNSLTRMIRVQERMRDFPGLVDSTTRFLQRYPRDGWAFTMRGWAQQEQSKYREAFADYEKATQLAYGPAFVNLGWYYEVGKVVQSDYRKAFDLYMIAASHGVEGARDRAELVRKGSGLDLR